jgi:hypothetical protein
MSQQKVLIERKEETLGEGELTKEETSGSGKIFETYETIRELTGDTMDFIDTSAQTGIDYTYRLTVTMSGNYMDESDVNVATAVIINTNAMQKTTGGSSSLWKILVTFLVLCLAGGGLYVLYLYMKNNPASVKGNQVQKKAVSTRTQTLKDTKPIRKVRQRDDYDDDSDGDNPDSYTKIYR